MSASNLEKFILQSATAVPKIETMGVTRRALPGTNFPLTLAPMVGLSHLATRRLMQSYLPLGAATLWPTEMLNTRRLPTEKVGQTPETLRGTEETLLVPQILGNEAEAIRKSCRILEDWGAYAIDINMGCPVEKALRHNYGVALMGDPDYARRVVEITANATSLPVSVKLRSGISSCNTGGVFAVANRSDGFGDANTRDLNRTLDSSARQLCHLQTFVANLADAGARWVTLHPRMAEQKRRGSADWNQIRELVLSSRIPIIGNGDIQTAQDVLDMLAGTGCSAAMSGRALIARPWLFWQIAEDLGWPPPALAISETGEGNFVAVKAPRTPSEEGTEFGHAQLRLLQIFRSTFENEQLGLRRWRFYLKTATPWLEFGHTLWKQAQSAATYSAAEDCIVGFFNQEQRMYAYSSLSQ